MKLKKINVLFECNSCRDYAFAEAFSKSKLLNKLYLFGENANASKFGIYRNLSPKETLNFTKKNKIDLFITFNECHSLIGLINYYKYKLKIPSIGVTKSWFQLEANKQFAKEVMLANEINTPPYIELKNKEDVKVAIKKFGFPFVIKYRALSAGFCTYVVKTESEVNNVIHEIYNKSKKDHIVSGLNFPFDNSLNSLAEEYIEGEEVSLMSLWDGKNLLTFEPIKDYKKALDNNLGGNTGGMGGYMPVNVSKKQKQMIDEYILKFNEFLKKNKPNFTGFIYSGLMLTDNELFVLEYNMRPGDTEGQILSNHLKNDFLTLLYRVAISKTEKYNIRYKNGYTACVCIANSNYLNLGYNFDLYSRNVRKSKIEIDDFFADIHLFISSKVNMEKEKNIMYSNSPTRLINLLNTSDNPFEKIYYQLSKMKMENIVYRKDIRLNKKSNLDYID